MSLPFLPLFASVYTLLISQTCSHVLCLPFLFFCLMASYLWGFVYSVHSTLNVLSPIFSVKILPNLKSSWHATSPTKPFLAPTAKSELPEHLHHYPPTLQHISLTPLPLLFLLFSHQIVSDSLRTRFGPMDCSMPSFPVLHYLLESEKVESVHWITDAIQPRSPSLPPPSSFAFHLS